MTIRMTNTDKNNGSPDFYEYPDLIGISMAPIDIISDRTQPPSVSFDNPMNFDDYQFSSGDPDPFNFDGYFI